MATIQLPTDKVEATNRLIPVGKYEALLRGVRAFDTQLSFEFFIEGQGTIFQTQNLSHVVGIQVLAGTMEAYDLDLNTAFAKAAEAAGVNEDDEQREVDVEKHILPAVEAMLKRVGAEETPVGLSVKHRVTPTRTFDNVSSVWMLEDNPADEIVDA